MEHNCLLKSIQTSHLEHELSSHGVEYFYSVIFLISIGVFLSGPWLGVLLLFLPLAIIYFHVILKYLTILGSFHDVSRHINLLKLLELSVIPLHCGNTPFL